MPILEAPPQTVQGEERVLLCNVTWNTYERLLRELNGQRGTRLTYEEGYLEIMSTSLPHERFRSLLGRMIVMLAFEMAIPLFSGGQATFRKRSKRRGFEPDESYWIANEPRMRGKSAYDPRVDPPPDLLVEVEITRSAIERLPIFAALGVREVWRYDGETLFVHHLTPKGTYALRKRSLAFPFLPVEELHTFLEMLSSRDETAILRSFVAWVREQKAKNWRE